ncbi:MAG TPA: RluA family pseudouridine synthase, partial [Planctomycetes bacterium]|nr:RluA family pseudouridine synthase [Planctomycetota bacterium]
RLDRALAELIPNLSKAQLQKIVRRGGLLVDGRRVVRSNASVRGGEHLRVEFPGGPAGRPLQVLHEDPDLVVVDKAPGMLVHPTERLEGGTLSELAVERFGPMPSVADQIRPGIVHRLDRDTSGVLVLARTPGALDDLRAQFRSRSVEKTYLALVHGTPDRDRFEVSLPLGPVPNRRDHQRVDPRGRPSHTLFEVLERFEYASLVSCRPTTGRRHQLRVHLASEGHPILGDKLYRPTAASARAVATPYHALHALELAFDHPSSGERLTFRAPLPPHMDALLRVLR